MRWMISCIFSATMVAAGCGNSSSMGGSGGAGAGATQATSSSHGSGGAAACSSAVALYPDTTCQAWLDQSCCAEEQACAADCRQVVACIDACPVPRTDACIAACAQSATAAAQAELDAIGTCSKSAPSAPGGTQCDWPQ